jgi:hypothetical protein
MYYKRFPEIVNGFLAIFDLIYMLEYNCSTVKELTSLSAENALLLAPMPQIFLKDENKN